MIPDSYVYDFSIFDCVIECDCLNKKKLVGKLNTKKNIRAVHTSWEN